MIKWKLDEETAKNDRVADWVAEMCESIAKDIDLPCKGNILICSGGPYRGQDVSVKYDVDKKEIKVDFYSPIRFDGRQTDALNYAKGLLKEGCTTRAYLEKKYPENWKEKWHEWREGMFKLSEQEQMDMLKELISDKKR